MISLMKKIVKTAPDETGSSNNVSGNRSNVGAATSGLNIDRLKQSIQDSVSAGMKSLTPTVGVIGGSSNTVGRRPSDKEISHLTKEEKSILQRVWEKEEKFAEEEVLRAQNKDVRKESVVGENQNCRICRRKLSGPDCGIVPYQKCAECGCRICEDCASYSDNKTVQSSSSASTGVWKCSLCRRKQSDQISSNTLGMQSDMHRVPSMRRMANRKNKEADDSEAKLKLQVKVAPTSSPNIEPKVKPKTENQIQKPSPSQNKPFNAPVQQKKQLPNIKNIQQKEELSQRRLPQESVKKDQVSYAKERYTSNSNKAARCDHVPDKYMERKLASRGVPDPMILVEHNDPNNRSVYGQKKPNQGTGFRSLSSASESSLDDHHHYREFREDSDGWRRRRSRVRRRTKIQRQRNYDEDPDSDPTNNATNFAYQNRCSSSRDSWDSLDAVDYDKSHSYNYGGAACDPYMNAGHHRHLLDVPTSGGGANNAKYSSGSCSDVSDVSADLSSVSSSQPVSPYHHSHQSHHARTRKLPNRPASPRPNTDLTDAGMYDSNRYYDLPLFDSSPSSDMYFEDRQFNNRYSHSSMTKSSSVEDTSLVGSNLYAPTVNVFSQRRSIPNLDMDNSKDVSNQLCTRSWSYNFDMERGDKQESSPDGSFGQSLPAITVEESNQVLLGNQTSYRHQNGGGSGRRISSPTGSGETSKSLNMLTTEANLKMGASRRRSTLADCENIRIVVHDVDAGISNRVPKQGLRRLVLTRSPEDRDHRTRGLGMRVVGGKIGSDGSLFAYVVWTVRGGPADAMGIRPGDKIIRWNGILLVEKTFEEVCAIMDRTGDRVELIVDPAPEGISHEVVDDQDLRGRSRRQLESSDSEWSYPSSPTRRRLPKIPVDHTSGFSVTGELGIQIWFNGKEEILSVVIVGARSLNHRRASSTTSLVSNSDSLPEAFVKLRLLPIQLHGCRAVKTPVAKPSLEPHWKKTFIYTDILPDEVMEKTVELSVWDKSPDSAQSKFLGEVKVDLANVDVNNHLIWYKLSPKQAPTLFSPVSSSVPVSPVLNNFSHLPSANQTSARQPFSKSFSDDRGDIFYKEDGADVPNGLIKSPSMDFQTNMKSNPWDNGYGNMLSSTPNLSSEYMSNSEYTSKGNQALQALTDNPVHSRLKNGNMKDQRQVWSDSERGDFVDKSRKKLSQKVKDKLAKTLILTRSDNPKRLVTLGTKENDQHASSRSSQSDLVNSEALSDVSTEDDDVSNEGQEGLEKVEIKLGNGQVHPKDYDFDSMTGFIQLSIVLVKGALEVDVIRAHKLKTEVSGQHFDTYVKTYLRDDGKHAQKRKTRVVRRKLNPKYNQILRYPANEAVGKDLVVMVWQRLKHLEHNKGIGVAQIHLPALRLSTQTKDWYLLFPMKSVVCVDNG